MGVKTNSEDQIFTQERPRSGFKVGPQNLPDGTWRRKVIKIKKELIHQAKIKKIYAKIKLQVPATNTSVQAAEPSMARPPTSKPLQEIHPKLQAIIDAPADCIMSGQQKPQLERKRRRRPPFSKEATFAEERKAEVQVKRAEFERKSKERLEKTVKRVNYKKNMSKARIGGRNGQRKLGRESKILLEKIQRTIES